MKNFVLVTFAATACLAAPAFAQQPAPAGPPVGPDWSKIEVKTVDLGNRTYMLEGFGGNTTIAAGDDGVIMVDGQFAQMHDKLKSAGFEIVGGDPTELGNFMQSEHARLSKFVKEAGIKLE